MRDTLKTKDYFDGYIAEVLEVLPQYKELRDDETESHPRRLGFAYDFFSQSCHLAISLYSAGAPMADVRPRVIEAVDALEGFVALGNEDQAYFLYGDGGGYSGGYDEWYRLLAWCILFDLPRDRTDVVLDYLVLQMRNPRQATDALVNRMVKALGYPGQDETDHLLWPQAYRGLYDCFNEATDRSVQLKAFIKVWYRKMGSTYWHNNHTGRHDTYFGYWCFEAAAVAKLLDIDDNALREHPHYPYDARHG